MLKTRSTKKFEKDIKLAVKRGLDPNKLYHVMNELVNERKLKQRYCDHALKGGFYLYRECHIEPDWLLLYHVDNDVITFARTGTHSDLFK